MKVLYVITSTDVGGAETSLLRLIQTLPRQYTVHVVSLKKRGSLTAQLQAAGATVSSLNMTGSGLGCVSKLVQEIETFKPDVVHALLFRAIEFARLACAGRHIKLVTTPHFDLSKKPCWMRLLDRSLKSIDTVCTAESASTYNYLLQHQHYPRSKTLFIGNSVEKSLFFKDNSLKNSMRSQKGFSQQDIIFISVARLAVVKNPQGLLRAFSKILPNSPHAKLVYVGEGPEREELEKFIKENNLKNKVFLVGTQQNINDWLNMADVFVLLSKEESLPLALLEAQQVGLPCLVSKAGDMPNQVEHGKNGFVCNFKDEILAALLDTSSILMA